MKTVTVEISLQHLQALEIGNQLLEAGRVELSGKDFQVAASAKSILAQWQQQLVPLFQEPAEESSDTGTEGTEAE